MYMYNYIRVYVNMHLRKMSTEMCIYVYMHILFVSMHI